MKVRKGDVGLMFPFLLFVVPIRLALKIHYANKNDSISRSLPMASRCACSNERSMREWRVLGDELKKITLITL